MRSILSAVVALATFVGAQSTTSIDVAAISVPAPTEVFVLPVVYVTEAGAPVLTATTLAATATPSSDAKATNVFDSPSDVSAAISSASELAVATSTPLSRVKRDVCVQQPLGISYNSVPDTAAAFAADAYYGLKAVAAGAPTGYVQTMSNLTASNSADQYMGFTLLKTYDVVSCVNQCNAISGCNSVNIYFERDPTINPDSSSCPQNPPSTINIKCVFWGGAVVSSNANNFGQWRANFQVLIAGSNGYMKSSYAAQLAAQASATPSSSSAAPAAATDAAGNIYTIYYSSDSTQGAYSNAQASSSYKDCMTTCDADTKCNAFTYVGGANGIGSGTCWLKSSLGSPSSSGNNVVSGTRSGKVSSSSAVRSTTATSSSTATSFSTATATSSTASSSSTATASSTTSTTSTASASSAATLTPTFSLTSGDSSSWLSVAPGVNGVTSWTFNQATAFKFQLNKSNGYLLEAQGQSTGFAATVAPAANGNGLQQVFFNPVGGSQTYVSCAQNTANTPHLDCKVKGVLQQTFVCDDNFDILYFVPVGGSTPGNCYPTSGFFYQ
ncbi:hypothetical protein KCU65_g9821, partial [Aureobasidium melanogenum]